MEKNYYDVFDIAEILKVNPKSVRELCASGELRAAKILKIWIVKREVFEEYYNKKLEEQYK